MGVIGSKTEVKALQKTPTITVVADAGVADDCEVESVHESVSAQLSHEVSPVTPRKHLQSNTKGGKGDDVSMGSEQESDEGEVDRGYTPISEAEKRLEMYRKRSKELIAEHKRIREERAKKKASIGKESKKETKQWCYKTSNRLPDADNANQNKEQDSPKEGKEVSSPLLNKHAFSHSNQSPIPGSSTPESSSPMSPRSIQSFSPRSDLSMSPRVSFDENEKGTCGSQFKPSFLTHTFAPQEQDLSKGLPTVADDLKPVLPGRLGLDGNRIIGQLEQQGLVRPDITSGVTRELAIMGELRQVGIISGPMDDKYTMSEGSPVRMPPPKLEKIPSLEKDFLRRKSFKENVLSTDHAEHDDVLPDKITQDEGHSYSQKQNVGDARRLKMKIMDTDLL